MCLAVCVPLQLKKINSHCGWAQGTRRCTGCQIKILNACRCILVLFTWSRCYLVSSPNVCAMSFAVQQMDQQQFFFKCLWSPILRSERTPGWNTLRHGWQLNDVDFLKSHTNHDNKLRENWADKYEISQVRHWTSCSEMQCTKQWLALRCLCAEQPHIEKIVTINLWRESGRPELLSKQNNDHCDCISVL